MVEVGIIVLMVTDDIFVKLNNDGICIGKCMYPTVPTNIRYHIATFIILYGCTLD